MTRAPAVLSLLVLLAVAAPLAGCRTTLTFDAPDAGSGCSDDQDCPLPSLHCERVSGLCLACLSNTDCTSAGRPRCDVALHICVQCGAPADCPTAGSICDATTRSCVRGCATATDCSTGTFCDDGICSQCDDDRHCTTAPRLWCDPATRQCTSCVTDAQCASPARCDRTSGKCVACLTMADCAGGTACDPTDWTCKPPNR